MRSALRRQPPIPAFGQASQETREWAGNPGFSRIRFRLWTPGLPRLRRKPPKVSGLLRKYSRFGETMGGDRFDHDCRPTDTRSSDPTRSAKSFSSSPIWLRPQVVWKIRRAARPVPVQVRPPAPIPLMSTAERLTSGCERISPGVAEDIGPLAQGEVGGDDNGGMLV